MDQHKPEFDDSLIAYRMMEEPRTIPLRQVGITHLKYPITVWDRTNRRQRTIGTFKLAVDLPKEFKSTHRSRLIAGLENHTGELSLETMPDVVDEIRNRLDAERAHVRVDFTYFIRKKSPASGEESDLAIQCWFVGDAGERDANFTLGLEVPVTLREENTDENGRDVTYCMRARARVAVRFREMVWLEELVEAAELSASSDSYTLLKREDEADLLARARERDIGVESLVRNIAERLVKDTRVTWFYVEAEADSPLQVHGAYASVGSDDL